jgi:hypothetical protein
VRLALVALTLLVAGCGGGDRTACREPGERYPVRPVSVAEAMEREGRLVLVQGTVSAIAGVPERICDRAERGLCVGAVLEVDGLRDLTAFESSDRSGATSWVDDARVPGRVDGTTLRFELSCRTEEVRAHVEEETGVELTMNPFQTTSITERIDVAPLPSLVPVDIRREWGVFSIAVRADDEFDRPIWSVALKDVNPDERGIYWRRENGRWYATTRYGRDVALLWLAGAERRVDERWTRLDRILRGL